MKRRRERAFIAVWQQSRHIEGGGRENSGGVALSVCGRRVSRPRDRVSYYKIASSRLCDSFASLIITATSHRRISYHHFRLQCTAITIRRRSPRAPSAILPGPTVARRGGSGSNEVGSAVPSNVCGQGFGSELCSEKPLKATSSGSRSKLEW